MKLDLKRTKLFQDITSHNITYQQLDTLVKLPVKIAGRMKECYSYKL